MTFKKCRFSLLVSVNSTTRQTPPICDPPLLFIAVIWVLIMPIIFLLYFGFTKKGNNSVKVSASSPPLSVAWHFKDV